MSRLLNILSTDRRPRKQLRKAGSVGRQAAGLDVFALGVDCRYAMPYGQTGEESSLAQDQLTGHHLKGVESRERLRVREEGLDVVGLYPTHVRTLEADDPLRRLSVSCTANTNARCCPIAHRAA